MNQPENGKKLTRTEKAGLYNRLKRTLALGQFGLGVIYLLVLLINGWNFDLRLLVMNISGGPVVWTLVFFLIVTVVYEIISLPLSIMSGYYVEKKFGLLNQTAAGWTLDLIKSQALGLFLGALAIEVLYLFLRLAGPWWWLPAGGAFALFFVILALLSPILIFPIFFKFKKLPENDLTRRLTGLCHLTGAKVQGIYEWGLSEKFHKANAALVGWGATRRVVLSDSLLTKFTPSEVEVIVAHELGHHRRHHIHWLLTIQIGVTFLAFFLADMVCGALGPYLGLANMADLAGFPLLFLVFMAVGLVAMPLVNWISRQMEREADLYALELTGLVGSFISALEHLTVMNLGEMEPHPLVEFFFYSHPSPAKRIGAAKEFMHHHLKRVDILH